MHLGSELRFKQIHHRTHPLIIGVEVIRGFPEIGSSILDFDSGKKIGTVLSVEKDRQLATDCEPLDVLGIMISPVNKRLRKKPVTMLSISE